MRIRIAAALGFVTSLGMGALVVAPATATSNAVTVAPSAPSVAASGGSLTIRGAVNGGTTCSWAAVPQVKGFNASVPCSAKLSRAVILPVNTTTRARKFTVTLTAVGHGSAKSVITEKGQPPAVALSVNKALLADSGGAVTVRATVTKGKTCAWSSSPKVKGFNTSVNCSAKLSRVAKLPTNTTTRSKRFTFTLTAVGSGSAKSIVNETGQPLPVFITSSANPATTNTQVTYTVAVASANSPQTTGQLEVSDNGQALAGCNPIPNASLAANGTFVGTCTTSYSSAATHNVVASFTGDTNYAPSQGSITETVNPAPTTTTEPGNTTATTLNVSFLYSGPSTGTLTTTAAIATAKSGETVTPSGGQVAFAFIDEATHATIGTYSGTDSNPATCTFNVVEGPLQTVITPESPDLCTGSVTNLPTADVNLDDLYVQASYAGTTVISGSSSSPQRA